MIDIIVPQKFELHSRKRGHGIQLLHSSHSLRGPTSSCSTIYMYCIAFCSIQIKGTSPLLTMDARARFSLVFSLFFIFFLRSCAARDHAREQLPSALVVGTVYCDTYFHQELSKSGRFISGASVAVECGDAADEPRYRKVVTTNRHGVFRVRLPPRISNHIHLIEACSVKLIKSNEPFCAVASSATTAGLRLKSKRNGFHVYSAGFFSFKPLNQPELCYQKRVLGDQKLDQPAFFLPTPSIPFLPPPPSVGGVPLPANPLFPPPSLLPPNPLAATAVGAPAVPSPAAFTTVLQLASDSSADADAAAAAASLALPSNSSVPWRPTGLLLKEDLTMSELYITTKL